MTTEINFRDLQRTNTSDVNEWYSQVERATEGTLTNAYGIVPIEHFGDLKSKYSLTPFQKYVVESLCKKLDAVAVQIDPHKLSGLDKNVMNEDGELILYRESTKGLKSITIYDEDLFSYGCSGKISSDDVLVFFDISEDIDFESIALKFIS